MATPSCRVRVTKKMIKVNLVSTYSYFTSPSDAIFHFAQPLCTEHIFHFQDSIFESAICVKQVQLHWGERTVCL